MLVRAFLVALTGASVVLACGGGAYDGGAAYPQQATCSGGAVPSGDQCFCPEGSQWDGAQCVGPVAAACPPGAVQSGDQCVCPPGTQWGGASCQVVIEQRTHQSSSSFTCCVNHAQYRCPDNAAFQRCSTLTPNHGCAPAGRC